MTIFILLVGQFVNGAYETLDEAHLMAKSIVDGNPYEEASIILTVIGAAPSPQWLVRTYSGKWIQSAYERPEMRDYGLPA